MLTFPDTILLLQKRFRGFNLDRHIKHYLFPRIEGIRINLTMKNNIVSMSQVTSRYMGYITSCIGRRTRKDYRIGTYNHEGIEELYPRYFLSDPVPNHRF